MEPATIVALIAAVGLPTVIGLAVKAFYERRMIAAQAESADATATAVVTAAARELVDPLRKELAEVRAEAKAGVIVERQKLKEVRAELQAATDEARELRVELSKMRAELDQLRQENDMYRRRNAELGGTG